MATVDVNKPRQLDPDFRTVCGIIATIVTCLVSLVTYVVLVIGTFTTLGFFAGIIVMLALAAAMASGLMWLAGDGNIREGIRWTFS